MPRSKLSKNRLSRLKAMSIEQLKDEISLCTKEETSLSGKYAKARRSWKIAKEEAIKQLELKEKTEQTH